MKTTPDELSPCKGIFEQTTFFGPAKVIAVQDPRVQLECPDAFPWARVAVMHGYRPVENDVVLAVGKGSDWYVIGILEGQGATTLSVPGDLRIEARNGSVEILGGNGVEVKGPVVAITTRRFDVAAREAIQRFGEMTQWVAGVLRRRLGRADTRIEGESYLRAERIVERAKGDVVVSGRTINLN